MANMEVHLELLKPREIRSSCSYNPYMFRNIVSFLLAAILSIACACPALSAQSPLPTASAEDRALAREIFKQLIEIDTTDTPLGNVTAGNLAMQKRFLDAGFPAADVQLVGPDARKQNLVVRIRAAAPTTKKPVLFLCHMDVVEALRSDWSTDPFQFVEKDGYYYGRGTQDMKESDAVLVATFLRLHREGYKPRRDLILALTADEEGGHFNGARWLVQQHRELVDAAYVINPDAGGVDLDHGRTVAANVETTEKIHSDFQITATNRGGHSSVPRPDNAIYELTAALNKLAAYTFPFEMNARPDSGRSPRRQSRIRLQLSHYLRSYPPQRRPCQQRSAANGAGQCQLPYLSRPLARGDPEAVDRAVRRRKAECEVCLQRRRCL
jgi:acetylornithine deacetylase/succinyl-diaminopimelate desuccinylase-like protein